MTSRRVPVVTVLAALGLLAAACGSSAPSAQSPRGQEKGQVTTTVPSTSAPPPPAAASSLPYWIINLSELRVLLANGMTQAEADYFFDNPKTFITQGGNGATVTTADIAQVHAQYPQALMSLNMNSVGMNARTGAPGFDAMFSSGSLPAGLDAVQYDPESQNSNGTPDCESRVLDLRPDPSCPYPDPRTDPDPMYYEQQALADARAHNLLFIFTPSLDAGMKPAEEGTSPHGVMKYCTWLNQGRAAWAQSSGADFYAIQNQQIEGVTTQPANPCAAPVTAWPTYQWFTDQAVAAAKAANPGVKLFLGIGINPQDPPSTVSCQDLMSDYLYDLSLGAAGIWNNVESHQGVGESPSVYVQFFNALYHGQTSC